MTSSSLRAGSIVSASSMSAHAIEAHSKGIADNVMSSSGIRATAIQGEADAVSKLVVNDERTAHRASRDGCLVVVFWRGIRPPVCSLDEAMHQPRSLYHLQ